MFLTFQIGQRVEAKVEQIRPYGVFVRLTDGTRAYIRRRELALISTYYRPEESRKEKLFRRRLSSCQELTRIWSLAGEQPCLSLARVCPSLH